MKIKPLFYLLFVTVFFNSMYAQTNVERYKMFQRIPAISGLSPETTTLINSKNKFNKNEIVLIADFTGPDGQTETVNGFWFKPFSITMTGSDPEWPNLANEILPNNGNSEKWVVRFSPTLLGVYTYSLRIFLPLENQTVTLESGSFTCVTGTDTKGFVKLVNQEYFQYSDGNGFNPLGLNVAAYPEWNDNGTKTKFYELFFRRLSENGGNFARIWVNFHGALNMIGYDVPTLQTFYDKYSLKDAFCLDKIIGYAEQYKIKLQFCIFASNDFNDDTDADHPVSTFDFYNPFSDYRGGPCSTPADFLTNSLAKANAKIS